MMKHARAMLIVVFGCKPKKSVTKKLLLEELVAQAEQNPDMIDDYDASIATSAVGAAGMQTTPAVNDVDESIAKSLFKACIEQVEIGDYFVTALELAIIVLDVV